MPSRLILLVFLSTPSVRRATFDWSNGGYQLDISIHALREEGDRGHSSGCSLFCYFYPRPPRGGRPAAYSGPPSSMTFLSTPSARRATAGTAHCPDRRTISIHALREEGDGGGCPQWTHFKKHFYPRPPRGGRRGAHGARFGGSTYFYPRPPRGGRLSRTKHWRSSKMISIHALREEGDARFVYCRRLRVIFLSTPSARRATFCRLSSTPPVS